MQKKWVLVFLSNEPYINKAFQSIQMARQVGQWTDDIVLLVSTTLYNHDEVKDVAKMMNVILREVEDRNFETILNVWRKHPEHEDYSYVMPRGFMYNKFHIFDTFFRQWDIVFYLDAGARINGPLERMKRSCEPSNCIYAHSDAYPTYEWKLSTQFCLDMFETVIEKVQMLGTYNLSTDYFQGTMCIYDTKIIEENTVDRLFELSEKYPIARRMDQGILNLYFLCERNLWKQIPVRDEQGFLYDYMERKPCRGRDYLILKCMYGEY